MPPSEPTEGKPASLRLDFAMGDAEPAEVDALGTALRRELLELDVERVDRVPEGEPPAGARAFEAFALGSLAITLVRNTDVLAGVVRTLQGWLARDQRRSVKIEFNGDTLEVTGVSSRDQEQLISAWLARHSSP